MGFGWRTMPISAALATLPCVPAQACDYPVSVLEGFAPTRRTIPADGHEDVRIRVSEVLISDREPLKWFGMRGEILASDDPSVLNRRIEVRGHWNASCFAPENGYEITTDRKLKGWVVGQFVPASSDANVVLSFASETHPVRTDTKNLHWRRLRWAEPS